MPLRIVIKFQENPINKWKHLAARLPTGGVHIFNGRIKIYDLQIKMLKITAQYLLYV